MRHLLGGGSVRHLLEDLLLAAGERGGVALLLRRLDLLDEGPGQLRMDHRLALDRQPGGVHELVRGRVLEQVAAHPCLDGLGDRGPRLVDRDEDDLGVGRRLTDCPSGFDPAHPRHPHVHEHHVRSQLAGVLDRLLAAAGLANDLHPVLHVEGGVQALAGHRVVVDDQDPDGHARSRGFVRACGH